MHPVIRVADSPEKGVRLPYHLGRATNVDLRAVLLPNEFRKTSGNPSCQPCPDIPGRRFDGRRRPVSAGKRGYEFEFRHRQCIIHQLSLIDKIRTRTIPVIQADGNLPVFHQNGPDHSTKGGDAGTRRHKKVSFWLGFVFLYNLMVAPVTPYHIIAGAMMTGILKIALSSGTAILLAYLLFSYSLFSLGLSLIPFVLCLVIMGWALGIMTTALILRFGQEAEVLAWGVIFLFQPVSAVFNPVSVLPDGFRQIAFFVPASHVFEGMRQVLSGRGFSWPQLGWALVFDLLYVAGSLFLFSRVLKRARKVGFSLKLGS